MDIFENPHKPSLIFLTIQYSLLQMIYWMSYCVIIGFALVYLKYLGFNVAEVGIILALSNILSVVLQPLIGHFSDKSTHIPLKYIISLLLLIVISLLAFLYFLNISSLLITGCIFTIISTIILIIQPLMNALILTFINIGIPVNYGLARGLGSFSFAIISFVLVTVISNYGVDSLPLIGIAFYIFIILIVLTFKHIKSIPETNKENDSYHKFKISDAIKFVFNYNKLYLFLIGIAFMFVFDSLVNTYILEIVLNANGTDADVGFALGIAAFVELPGMMSFIYLTKWFKVSNILLFSCFMFCLKGIGLIFSVNVYMVYVSQSLQCISFALLLPAAVYYINQVVRKDDLVKGQAILMTALTFGGIFGTFIGGWVAESFGVLSMLLFGTSCAITGTLFLLFSLKKI